MVYLIFLKICFFAYLLKSTDCFTEKICIKRKWLQKDDEKHARLQFFNSMKPHMREMKHIRRDLAQMRDEMMAKKHEELRPSAMLAEAMVRIEREHSTNVRRKSEGFENVAMLNRAINDFMYQSDILLDIYQSAQMLEDMHKMRNEDRNPMPISLAHKFANTSFLFVFDIKSKEGLIREKRQAQTGRNFPQNQWDPNVPIPYYFDASLKNDAKKVINLALKFWTENTCMSFVENGSGFPRVRFFSGGGCYSQVGRAFRQREQMISIGRGCEQFGIAAHEIGHTLGFFHGQARSDRDNFINVVYSNLNPQMATQFAKQSPENNYNYGVNYDYGSIMHYSDTDARTSRVTMIAKDKIYQHTMGNNVAPSFLDVMEMNIYYKCRDNCLSSDTNCKNGGYRHPRNCSTCICPWGFGGSDCTELAKPENVASGECGGIIVDAKAEFQTIAGGISASVPVGLADRHSTCFWHIKAPKGKRVELQIKSLAGACADGCFYGGTEIKTKDFLRVGARICCRSDIKPLGILFSETELAILMAFSQYKRQSFSILYRSVDPANVPPSGRSDYPPEEGEDPKPTTTISPPKTTTKSVVIVKKKSTVSVKKPTTEVGGDKRKLEPVCQDLASNCYSIIHLCDNSLYRTLMARQCAMTCMKCESGGATNISGGRNGNGATNISAGKNGNGGGIVRSNNCGNIRDHESCSTWVNNGFCASIHYTTQIKREICPQTCKLC